MQRSGFVVRFVDVVLILLFGFISISSTRETEIDLPESSELAPPLPEMEEVLFVAIRGDGTYLVDNERQALGDPESLYRFLAAQLADLAPTPVKVRIRAAHDAPMGVLVEASRVCEELAVATSFEVQLAPAAG